jgi:AAA15 family ATPase/GTPase
MSHIKNIEIKNFKSIRHAKIEDCRRVNVFIGYPNVGKSNILEAMGLISYFGNEDTDIVPLKKLCRYRNVIELFNDGKEKDSEIYFNNYVGVLKFSNQNRSILSFFITSNYWKRASRITENWWTEKEFMIDSEGKPTTNHSPAKGKIKSGDIVVLKKYNYNQDITSSETNPTVLSFPYGENLTEILKNNSLIREEAGELLAPYNLKFLFQAEKDLYVQKQLDQYSVFQFSVLQVADSLQRLIFHKAAIKSNKNSVLLFEEPEAHMFPPYISKFTADVMYDDNNNQFFITTHSPFVLNDFMENLKKEEYSIYTVGYKKETGETVIRRMTDEEIHEIYQYGVDVFFNLENYLQHEQQ